MVSLPAPRPAAAPSLGQWPPLNLYIREMGRQAFPVDELIFLQAEANYSWLQWANGQRLLMPRTLKFYTAQLPSEWFIRLHRNYIVNRHYITRIERSDSGGLVYLTSGQVFSVSRRRWTQVRRLLNAPLSLPTNLTSNVQPTLKSLIRKKR